MNQPNANFCADAKKLFKRNQVDRSAIRVIINI